MPDPRDEGMKYTAHAVVEKWSAQEMDKISKKHGNKRYERDELVALGYQPDEVTDDGTTVPGREE